MFSQTINKRHRIQYHNAVSDVSFSFLIGTTAIAFVMLSDRTNGLVISMAVCMFITAAVLAVKYVNSRYSSIYSIHNAKQATFSNQELNTIKNILPPIKERHMSKLSIEQIENEECYYLGFGFKRGFVDWIEGRLIKKSPLKHSSMIFVPSNIMRQLDVDVTSKNRINPILDNQILVLGRQSPVFRSHHNPHKFWSFPNIKQLRTEIDNEVFYKLFPGATFESLMSNAILSGKEIKLLVNMTNEFICDAQLCNIFDSNCYSASITMLAIAINILCDRHKRALHNTQNRDETKHHSFESKITFNNLQSLCNLMLDVLEHNFGQGMLNNAVVIEQVNHALKIAEKFDPERPRR